GGRGRLGTEGPAAPRAWHALHAKTVGARRAPDAEAGAGIQGADLWSAGDVHDAIHHDRLAFQPHTARHEGPLRLQLLDVLEVDLGERTVVIAVALAVIGRP